MNKGQQLSEPVWTDEDYRKNELEVWNAAIEEAAKIAADYQSDKAAAKIRSLKKMSHISYSDDELPIPTYYCSECNNIGQRY